MCINYQFWIILKNLFTSLNQSGVSMIIAESSKDVNPGNLINSLPGAHFQEKMLKTLEFPLIPWDSLLRENSVVKTQEKCEFLTRWSFTLRNLSRLKKKHLYYNSVFDEETMFAQNLMNSAAHMRTFCHIKRHYLADITFFFYGFGIDIDPSASFAFGFPVDLWTA